MTLIVGPNQSISSPSNGIAMEENEIACESDEDTIEYEIEVVSSASSVSLGGPSQSMDDQLPERAHQSNNKQEAHETQVDQSKQPQAPAVEEHEHTQRESSGLELCVSNNQIEPNRQLSGTDRDAFSANNDFNNEPKTCKLDAEPLITNKPIEIEDKNRLSSDSAIAPTEPTDNYAAQVDNHDLDDKLDCRQNSDLNELQASKLQMLDDSGQLSDKDNSTELSICNLHETDRLEHENIPESATNTTTNLTPETKDGQEKTLIDSSSMGQQEVPKFYDLTEKEQEAVQVEQRVDCEDVRQKLSPATVDLIASEQHPDRASEHERPLASHVECHQSDLMTAASSTAPPKPLKIESSQSASNDSAQTHHNQPSSTEQTCAGQSGARLINSAAATPASEAAAAAAAAAGGEGKSADAAAVQTKAESAEVIGPSETVTVNSGDSEHAKGRTAKRSSSAMPTPAPDAISASGGDHVPVMNLIECRMVSDTVNKEAELVPDKVVDEQLQIEKPVSHELSSASHGSGSTKVVDEVDSDAQLKDDESVPAMNYSDSNDSKPPPSREVQFHAGPEIGTTKCVGDTEAHPQDALSQECWSAKADAGEHPKAKVDDSLLSPALDTYQSSTPVDISVERVPTAPQVILSVSESTGGDEETGSRSASMLDKGQYAAASSNDRDSCYNYYERSGGAGDESDGGNYSPSSADSKMHNLRLDDDNLFAADYDDVDDLERELDEEPEFESRNVVVKRNRDPRDEYELGTELGRGRFGTVFKCTETATGRQLAAKFISMRNQEDRENVEREVAIMSLLQHKRLLQLYDAFDEGPQEMCLITELVEGGELFERIVDDDFELTEKKAAVFMRQICEGVEYMHSKQVVHLDMKPENILCLSRTGHRIKLIDFGLARRLDPLKPIRVMFGTPDFAAPEVLGYETVTLATDMWSVGVICYVLLSGLSPFMGENDMDTMANVTRATYDFNDQAFEPISELAKDFIAKLLLRQPEKRLKPSECLRHAWLQRGGAQLEVAVRERRESTSVLHRLAMEQAVAAAALATSATMAGAADISPPIFNQQHRASFGAESTTSSGLVSLDKRRLKRYVVRRKWHRMVHAIMALNRMGANLVFR